MNTFEIVLAIASIGAIAGFSSTQKDKSANRFTNICRHLMVPAAIACLWALALTFGWWTIAIFAAISLAVSLPCALYQRRKGANALDPILPVFSVIFLCGALVSSRFLYTVVTAPEWFVWCPVC